MNVSGPAPASPHAPETRECFVVQRCWHSGPQQYQPLDCLRLFTDRRHAEDAAYHSANAWAQAGADRTVRTLLLPSIPPVSDKASYGFVARGSLFWVRSVRVTKVVNPSNTSVTSPSGMCRTNHWLLPPSPAAMAAITTCFAVVTEGVIGGTGNKNSRRGTEVSAGRVFAGPSNDYAKSIARHVARQCDAKLRETHTHPCHTCVAALPIGKDRLAPADAHGASYFLDDWPTAIADRFGGAMPRVAVPKRDRDAPSDARLFAPSQSPLTFGSQAPQDPSAINPFAFNNNNDSSNVMCVEDAAEHFPSPTKRRRTGLTSCSSASKQPLTLSSLVSDDEMMMH